MFDPKIYDKLSNFAAYQERSLSDIKEKLRKLKIEKEEYEGYINKLREDNFLNDERYVKSFISAHSKKKWGKVKMKMALQRKGANPELVKQYLDDIETEGYDEQIKLLATRKWNSIRTGTPRDKNTKLIRFLLGKGFEMGKILAVINHGVLSFT